MCVRGAGAAQVFARALKTAPAGATFDRTGSCAKGRARILEMRSLLGNRNSRGGVFQFNRDFRRLWADLEAAGGFFLFPARYLRALLNLKPRNRYARAIGVGKMGLEADIAAGRRQASE